MTKTLIKFEITKRHYCCLYIPNVSDERYLLPAVGKTSRMVDGPSWSNSNQNCEKIIKIGSELKKLF